MSTTAKWAPAYALMRREWELLTGAANDVEGWHDAFERMRAEERDLRRQGLWLDGAVDLLRVTGRSRREVDHCAILAWLLEADMPHGLGDRLLRKVLERCFREMMFPLEHLKGARSRCEIVRDSSRADVVVTSPFLTLVIEAKIDHVERPDQCLDLYNDYCEERGARFIFLTCDGRKPCTEGSVLGAYRSLSFRDLRHDLLEAINEAGDTIQRQPGYHSLACYLQCLEAEFP